MLLFFSPVSKDFFTGTQKTIKKLPHNFFDQDFCHDYSIVFLVVQ